MYSVLTRALQMRRAACTLLSIASMALREPTVRIRELGSDYVNFVLENVDLAWRLLIFMWNEGVLKVKQVRKLAEAGRNGRPANSRCVLPQSSV